MTAPHDTQRRGCPLAFVRYTGGRPVEEGQWAPIYEDVDRYRALPHWEVAPVQSEGERFPQYVLAPDGNVSPVLAVTDEMVDRGAEGLRERFPFLAARAPIGSFSRAVLEAAFNCSPPTTQEARTDG